MNEVYTDFEKKPIDKEPDMKWWKVILSILFTIVIMILIIWVANGDSLSEIFIDLWKHIKTLEL